MSKAAYIVDQLFEAGPDDVDPKAEFLNTEPDAVPWLLDNGFTPFHPGSRDTYRKTYTHGWAVVHATAVGATPYELVVDFRSGGRQHYPDLTFGELRRTLEHHFIAEAQGPDDLDPKGEMLRVDPSADIRKIIARFKRQDLDVHSWSRQGDLLKIKALPLDTGMNEEEVEMGVYAELQRMGIPVDPMSVVVSKRDGWFIIIFPLPGMPAQSHKRRLPESGPDDDIDPKDYVKKLPEREPRMAYALLPSVMLDPTETVVSPIIVKEGEPGYHQTDWRWNKAHAQAALDAMNAKLGLTPTDAEYVLMSSMFPKKAAKRRLKEAGPDDIDPKDEFMALDPLKAMYSQIAPASTGWARLQVVLKPAHREGEWVTRIRNADNGGESWGHYFMDYAEAVKDFRARCEKYGLPPEPMEMTAVFEEGPDDVNPRDMLRELPEPIFMKLYVHLPGQEGEVEDLSRSVLVDANDYLNSLSPQAMAKYYRFAKGRRGGLFTFRFYDDSAAAINLFSQFEAARGLVQMLQNGAGSADLSFDSESIIDWVEKNRPEVLNESGPDDVDPREYLRALSARDPRIKITFSRTTPESAAEGDVSDSGWIDEEGVSMMPDLIDHEDGVGVVDLAVKFLQKEGATQASASHFHQGVWYSTGYDTVDYSTGEDEEKNYHLHGFLPEEEQEVWDRLHQRRVAVDDARYN